MAMPGLAMTWPWPGHGLARPWPSGAGGEASGAGPWVPLGSRTDGGSQGPGPAPLASPPAPLGHGLARPWPGHGQVMARSWPGQAWPC